MSNTTDTNQASEDNLGKILETLSDSSASRGWLDCSSGSKGVHPRHDLVSIAKEVIQELIRTEKLKLLAEVRERVVGEDRKEHIPYCGIGCPHDELVDLYRCTCGLVGSPRNKQLVALTKLEAEL